MILNLDGLVGPSHFYGGLALGNIASSLHKGDLSSPKKAALQGLEKMWALHNLGLPQGIVPPPLRPNLSLLQQLGFSGTPASIIQQSYRETPELLAACYSASSMWAANSATITPSSDATDHRLHITPANLNSALHRSQEAEESFRYFRTYFNDNTLFHCHSPLPSQRSFADEGAANHIRLHDPTGDDFIHLFIYGDNNTETPSTAYPARQNRLASEAIIRRHNIPVEKVLLIQQNQIAIDKGAFHNDVVAVGHGNFLLLHELAFADQASVIKQLRQKTQHWQQPPCIYQVDQKSLSLEEAIHSYLFNSQLISLPAGQTVMIAPLESQKSPSTLHVIQRLLEENTPLSDVRYFDLRQSMNNGGGPACLRLAIPITETELAAVDSRILMSDTLYSTLNHWINRHYRDRLSFQDLADPLLYSEIRDALCELNNLLHLEPLYSLPSNE